MKNKISLIALLLLCAFNVYAKDDLIHKLSKDLGIVPTNEDGVSIFVDYLSGTYSLRLPKGFYPNAEISEQNKKTVISFPKSQSATNYTEAITLGIYKKARPGEDYVTKEGFEKWVKEEEGSKCNLGYKVYSVFVFKEKNKEYALGDFVCNYKDESNREVYQVSIVMLKQLRETYFMSTASIKKLKYEIKNVADMKELLDRTVSLSKGTIPLMGCPNKDQLLECLKGIEDKYK